MDRDPELAAGLVSHSTGRSAAGSRRSYWKVPLSRRRILVGCLSGVAAVALVTFVGFRLHLNLSTCGFLYFLVVVLVSLVWGFLEASVTSLIAVNCLNYFFTPPILTFRIADPQDWVSLGAFEITALVVSRLSTRAQNQARAEARHRAEVEKLYALSRRILLLDRRQATGPQIVSLIQEIFRTESAAVFDAASARPDTAGPWTSDLERLALNAYLRDSDMELGGVDLCAHVLRLGSRPVGGIAVRGGGLSRLTVAAIASLAAIALERARSFQKESLSEAARQTEELRTAVLDALAHAFKTPLTAIRTASSGLLETGRLSSDDLELATLIDEQAELLNRLTTELLQMARIDATEVRLRRERLSVLTLIEDVLERFRGQLHGRQVTRPDSASGLELHGDREILTRALEQFVDNACRYSTPASPISLAAEEQLGEIVIAVHNQGPPIRPSDRERIFERFYRAEDARHRAPGTGLGLSIAKKAAEAHGGRTWVVSDAEAGTTFYFALPHGSRRELDADARQDTHR